MMDENSQPQEFLAQFHNLKGVTIDERQQNLYQLFRQYQPHFLQEPNDLDIISTNLNPQNYLETIFRVKFLIYFRRFQELYKEFCRSDLIVLKNLSGQEWFFQKAFGDLGADQLVNDVFPTFSYIAKLKTLRKLPLNEEQSDQLFDCIHNRYGLHLATIIVPKCSSRKIKEILENNRIKLDSRQLQIICEKDPNLIKLYIEQGSKYQSDKFSLDYNPILKYVAQKNPEVFMNLITKYQFKILLGYRTSNKIINSYKNIVLAKFDFFFNILNKRSLVKILGSELKEFFFNTNPEGIGYWQHLLKNYPKKSQFLTFKAAFIQHYHGNFGETIDDITEEIFKFVPDALEREKLAIAKFENGQNLDYLKHCRPETSIQIFLEKFDKLDINQRASYINTLTDGCILYNDLDFFSKLLDLIRGQLAKYQNVRYLFIKRLCMDHSKILDIINEQQWDLLLDTLESMNPEVKKVVIRYIEYKFIEFLIKCNKPAKEYMLNHQNWLQLDDGALKRLESTMAKRVFAELIEIVDEKSIHDYQSLISFWRRYNQCHVKDTIDILKIPGLANVIKKTLEGVNDGFNDETIIENIRYIACQRTTQTEFKEIKNLVLKNLKIFGIFPLSLWFLKQEPQVLAENFDEFLSVYLSGLKESRRAECNRSVVTNNFYFLIRKYSHLGMDTKMAKFYLSEIKEYRNKEFICEILSIIAPNEYLNLIKTYLISHEETETSDEETEFENDYEFQYGLIRFLDHIDAPSVVLSVIAEFHKDDYVIAASSSIDKSFYRIPENEIRSLMEQLETREVFKKHSISLSCIINDADTVYNLLKNTTLPVLIPFFKYFVRNPSGKFWELLEMKLSNLNEEDVKLFKQLLRLSLPIECKVKCIKIMWKNTNQSKWNKEKESIIEKIVENMKDLEPQFLYEVIESTIFKFEGVNSSVSNLLIQIDDDKKFDFIARILANFKEIDDQESHHKLHDFISTLYDVYMKKPNYKNDEFVLRFSEIFGRIFGFMEAFEENLMIKFMKLKNDNVEEISKVILQLNHELIDNHGDFVLNLFIGAVNDFLVPRLFETEQQKIEFCHNLLKFSQSAGDYILIIKLLPLKDPKRFDSASLHGDILNKLKSVDDDSVQLHLNAYLKTPPPPPKIIYKHRPVRRYL